MARPPRTEHAADGYARQVVKGLIPAGKYHRLACARHARDRQRERSSDFPWTFSATRADRFVAFAQSLRHFVGEWTGQPIILQPFQVFRLGSLFGWIDPATGLRRFRTAYHEIPRKNGKSLEAALVALYGTFFDGEAGAEGYCAATKRAQAKIVFDVARELVARSNLHKRLRAFKHNLHRTATASKLEPLGADYNSTDGLNPHVVILDEFHALTDRGMVDVLETATGARRQPIIFEITTAGDDPISPCGDQHEYATKILDGEIDDDTFFAFIAHADEGDDWRDEQTWRKANPNYGVTIHPDDLRAKVAKAINMPAAVASFEQKHLNRWVNRATPWLSMDGWRAGQSAWSVDDAISDLYNEPCYAGIDLSSKTDLTAITLAFPPTAARRRWRYLGIVLTPEDTISARAIRDRVPYAQWKALGWLRTNPGKRIDHDAVRAIVNDLGEHFDILEIGYDPWNAGNLPNDLDADGYVVTEVPINVAQLSRACKEFEADVLDGLADFGDNPAATWQAGNVVVLRDTKDNILPTKKSSRGRIDLIVAAIIARKLAEGVPEPEAVSAYASHRLEVV